MNSFERIHAANDTSDKMTVQEDDNFDINPDVRVPLVLSAMPALDSAFQIDSHPDSMVLAGIDSMTSETMTASGLDMLDEVQEKQPEYYCKICDESFKKRWQWNKHRKRKHKRNELDVESDGEGLGVSAYICHVCGMDLKRVVDFRKHIRMHENLGIFKCGVCHLQFNDSMALNQHQLAEQHESIPQAQKESKRRKYKRVRFNCPFCGKEFYEKSHYQLHYRTHSGERPYTCGICSKDFAGTGGLREHMKIHTGEKNHVCSECGKGFYGPSKLKNHMRIHTGDRPYKCNYCGKGFIESGKLKRHLRIHTGEQPYSCPVCGRGFNVISNLSKHMIVHTGIKPYPCDICGKAFAQKINMQVHMKIHSTSSKKPNKGNQEKSREGQHVCNICGETFKKVKDLRTHRKIHRKENNKMDSDFLKTEDASFQRIVLMPGQNIFSEDVSVDSTLAKLNDTENFKFRIKGKVKGEQVGVGKLLEKENSESNGATPVEFDLNDSKGNLITVETGDTSPSHFLSDIQIKAEPLEYDFELEDAAYMEQFDPSLERSFVDSYIEGSFKREDDLSSDSESPFTGQLSEDMSLSNHNFQVKVEPFDDNIDSVDDGVDNETKTLSNASTLDSDFKGLINDKTDLDSKPMKRKRDSKKSGGKKLSHGKSKRQHALKFTRLVNENVASDGDYTCPGCRKSFPNKQKLALHSVSCDEEADLG